MAKDNPGVDDLLNQHQQQVTSPAAPAGLQQEAASATGVDSLLAQHQEEGYVPSSQSWYTGANTEGTDNGWDSTFSQRFVEGANKAMEEGTLDSYYESKEDGKGTGIVLYNFTSDQGTEMKFGDIYENGEKTGNVYDQFDEDTANLMLADWMFDGDEKAEIYSKSDPMAELKKAVTERATTDSQAWITAKDMEKFNETSATNAAEFQEGAGDEAAAVLGGIATGGMATAGALAVTGVGAPVALVVGGVAALAGGTAAYLNRDAISEAAGRAYTITSMSREEFGLPAAIGTGIEQWSGVGGKLITPFGNTIEGSYDYFHGDVGDGVSQYYADNVLGEVGGWWKAAHVAAAVGDAGLQFASPLGVAMFQTQMVGQIGGAASSMAFSGGNTFDYQTASFDNVFTDDSGGFDPLSAAAGLGKIGIDAIQLGFTRGLAGKVDTSLTATGQEALYGLRGTTTGFNVLRPWRNAEAKETLAAGGSAEIHAGQEFIKDAAGNVVQRRATIQLLAPSEQLQYFSTRIRALRETRARNGEAIDIEDWYAAAKSLSQGERKANMILVNAFGEGYEEGLQGILEPWSHNHSFNWNDLVEQFAYGAAMGGGMSGAAAINMAKTADKQFAMGQLAYRNTGRGELSRDAWNGMSEMEKRNVVALGNMQTQQLQEAYRKVSEEQGAEMMATVAGREKLMDAARKKMEAENKRAVPYSPDAAITIVALDDASFRGDAVTSSSVQLARNISNRLNGFELHLETLTRELQEARALLAKDPASEEQAAKIADIETRIEKTTNSIRLGGLLLGEVQAHLEDVADQRDFGAVEASAAVINGILEDAFDRNLGQLGGQELSDADKMALAKVVSQVKTRDPQDAARSYQVLLPQVDPLMTFWNADGMVGISQTILPAIRGDYDGDKVRDQNQLMLDDSVFTSLRAGSQFIGAGRTVNVEATKSEKEIYRKVWEALQLPAKSGLKMEALGKILEIATVIRDRYDGVLPAEELEGVLSKFLDAFQAGPDHDARAILVTGLANMDSAGALTDYARGNLTNEWVYISTLVNRKMQEFQRIYAEHTPRSGELHTTGADVARPTMIEPEDQIVGFELRSDLGFASNELGIVAVTRDGRIAAQATYNETDTALTYHLASVNPEFQGQGLSRSMRILFEDYALRRGLQAIFPDVINPQMADGYRARPERYNEITREGDPYPSFASTIVPGSPEADALQAEATRIREDIRRGAEPEKRATDVKARALLPGNTEGAAMVAELPADSIFRMFQQLHYTLFTSRDTDAQLETNNPRLVEMAKLYEALSSMISRSVLEEVRGRDEVNSRVVAMMTILARDLQNNSPDISSSKAMALVANLRVLDYDIDADGNFIPGSGAEITLAQFLLKQELNAWKQRNAQVWGLDPDLEIRYKKLLALTYPPTKGKRGSQAANAERAFVEVFGAQPLHVLLGGAAESLGSNLTVEQYVRMLADMRPDQRKAHAATLRLDENYRSSENPQDGPITPPYDLKDIENNDIEHATAFRSAVESMLSTANARQKERERDSKETSKALHRGHAEIRRLLSEYAGVKESEITHELLVGLLTNNPTLARRVYDLIPDSAANLGLPEVNGKVMVSNWVYDMLLETDPEIAEMIYFRNLLLLQWDAVRIDKLSNEADYADEAALQFSDLKRRLHQVMWDLRNNHDGGILYSQFLVELEKGTQTVDTFLEWVNSRPEVLGNRAPIVAWYDDPADFDMDKAGGGWGDVLVGAELRTAIKALATTAKGISVVEDMVLSDQDKRLVRSIQRYLDPNEKHTPKDEERFNQLEQRLKEAGRRGVPLGPTAMFLQVVAAARGSYGTAHKKGANPNHLEAVAAIEAWAEQFGYLTNQGRLLASVTAHTMEAVDGNLSLTAGTGGRSMDPETGELIQWDSITPELWLEMMTMPESRKLARAIVSSQVMERDDDGAMRVKTLHGKSVQDLLDGTSYRDLYERGEGESQFDVDLRYLSTLEAEASRFGGHFAVQRRLNELVIARITSAKATLTDEKIQQMVVEAMQDFARQARISGSLPVVVDGEVLPVGDDIMDELHENFTKTRRKMLAARRLDLTGNDVFDDKVLDMHFEEKEQEFEQVLAELQAKAQSNPTPEVAREIQAQIEAHERDMVRYRELFEILRTDNLVAAVMEMFAIPDVTKDPEGNAAGKRALVQYVLDHPTLRAKVPESMLIVNRILSNARLAPDNLTMNNISDKEWGLLHRSVVAAFLDSAFLTSAPTATVSPIPEATAELAYRQQYYDHTFSYLATPFMDGTDPILRAARSLQFQSGRHQTQVGREDVIAGMTRNIFKEGSLGDWNPDVPKFIIESHSGLDSASGIPAISIFGTLNKREEAIAAAKERTFDVPPDELLSSVALDWVALNDGTLTNPITITHPTGDVERPLAQLLNRFAKTVTATFVDAEGNPVEVDLLLEQYHVGRVYGANDQAATSGLYEVHTERILSAVKKLAKERNVPEASIKVAMAFFHPDMKPAEPGWYNNLFFEGTSFYLDADVARSLPETLNFYEGGQNPVGQGRALDSRKLGVPGFHKAELPTFAEVQAMEADFATDLSGVIRAKAALLMSKDLGNGPLEPEYYNAVYSSLLLRHFVDHVVDGQTVRWTAEQVIAHQLAGGEPLVNPKLWIPSDDVLRTLVGGTGRYAATSLELEIEGAPVGRWQGVTETVASRFPPSDRVLKLQDTDLVNRQAQRQLMPRARLSPVERKAFDARIAIHDQLLRAGRADRGMLPQRQAGFNPRANLERIRAFGSNAILAEDIRLSLESAGINFVAPRDPSKLEHSLNTLQTLLSQADANTTGFIYQHAWPDEHVRPDDLSGILTQVSLQEEAPRGMGVLPGDIVLINTASFRGDFDLAMKQVEYFVKRGAIIVLAEDTGRTNMRAELAAQLEQQQYERLGGSIHIYKPIEFNSRYRAAAAKKSTLTATRPVSPASRLVFFLSDTLNTTENTVLVNSGNKRLNSISETVNVIQSDVYGGFNQPSPGQVAEVVKRVQALDTTEGRTLLLEQSVGHLKGKARKAAEEDFREAWEDLIDRLDRNPNSVLPAPGEEFGTGSIIPLFDGHRIIFYRHGHQAPRRDKIEEMLAMPLREGSLDAANVAIYSGSTDDQATSHRGKVIGFSPYSKFGFKVNLEVDTQTLGDKKLFQWNGFKALFAPRPKHIKMPLDVDGSELPLFRNGIGIDGFASIHDIVSKHAFGDIIDNHQTAFWFFGVNFLPDVAKFLGVKEDVARDILLSIRDLPRITVDDAHRINTQGAFTRDVLQTVSNALGSQIDVASLNNPVSPEGIITLGMITYLMTEGAQLSHVLRSGSFADTSTDSRAQSVEMPELFTQLFDLQPMDSPLRLEMNRRFNNLLQTNQDGDGFVLHPDFTLEIRNPETGDWMQGKLQVPEVHSSGDNPVFNQMTYDEFQTSSWSPHSASMVAQALAGTPTARVKAPSAVRGFLQRKAVVTRQEALAADGGAWSLLTGLKPDDGRSAVWRVHSPMESIYLTRGAEPAMIQFRQALDMEGWDENDKAIYIKMRRDIMELLGLKRTQVELVDYWVRQMGGQWKDVYSPGPQNELTSKAAIEYAKDVINNVTNGYYPTLAAEIPAVHLADAQLIFRANQKARKWAPRYSLDGKKTDKAGFDDWNSWAEIALGSILTTDNLFSPMYLTALDGFLHTWDNATPHMTDLPVSMDVVRSAGLMDPETNKMLVSLSSNNTLRLQQAPLLGVAQNTLEEILGGASISGRFQHSARPTSEIAKRRNARREWAKKNGVPLAVDVTLKDLKKNGIRLQSESSNTNALMRMAINLRVGTALLNPMLYLSMGPEQWVRGSLDRTANILTGQATTGLAARAQAKVGWSSFTPEDLRKLDLLYKDMGDSVSFKFSIWEALDFLNPVQHGQARVSRYLEKYARMGAMMQDPTRGMSAKTLARRYVEAALQIIASDPLKYGVTPQYVISALSTDPMWIEKNLNDVHVMASNALAQIRSLKSTPLSLMVRGIYEPFSESKHAGRNFFGTLLLKLPLIFSTYGFNVLTTITGMQGFSDILAASIDGRQKGPGNIFYRIQTGIRGEEVKGLERIDMTEVMEGIDLSRSFIRGGLTHTGLMMLGMAAGNLGLSGEDDETRKRRKLLALTGQHPVLDPTALENDFRNKDAVFLDWLPFNLEQFFAVPDGEGGQEYVAQLPWLLKQFVSPVIGMGRFFETGDFAHVRRGFEDAVGSFPLINTGMWADAVETADTLQNLAKEQEEFGREENMANAMWFLTSAVGMYEKMLFENSFVNEVYVAMDRYDRNPYILPLRDSDGELQRDIEGNVRPNDIALESFINEDGEVQQGYQGRDDASATLHALTENRATLAFLTSLFTGGPADSDFNRYNMPVKTRTMDADVATQDEAEAVIRAAMEGAARQGQVMEKLSYEEIFNTLKSNYAEAGNWDGYNQADVEAKRMYQAQDNAPAALSILDEDGREVLTEAGAMAVLTGLSKGLVNLGDASLAGIHITFETREAIQKQWMADLKQEGIDMGLSETDAMKRVNRLWYGPTEDPTIPGIKDFVWSDQISYDKTLTYAQLNTTYVQGPDGRPWATGFRRDNLFNLTGLLPLNAAFISEKGGMSVDSRMNSTDLVNGINTGLRSLELVDKSSYIPTDKEIGDSIVKALEELGNSTAAPFTPYKTNSTGGGYGGGGYSGGGGGGYFSKMYAPAGGMTPYSDNLSSINTSNPYIRRASIRRERVWSEKGRLKQWQ